MYNKLSTFISFPEDKDQFNGINDDTIKNRLKLSFSIIVYLYNFIGIFMYWIDNWTRNRSPYNQLPELITSINSLFTYGFGFRKWNKRKIFFAFIIFLITIISFYVYSFGYYGGLEDGIKVSIHIQNVRNEFNGPGLFCKATHERTPVESNIYGCKADSEEVTGWIKYDGPGKHIDNSNFNEVYGLSCRSRFF